MNSTPFIIRPWRIDYTNQRETHEVKIPPRIIYRYLNFKRAKQVIKTKKLWFSSPDSFNDPYDMYPGLIDLTMTFAQAQTFIDRNYPYEDAHSRLLRAIDLMKREREFAEYQKNMLGSIRSQSGVCCFSRERDVSLMWGHYADSHRGIVIGFNIDPVNLAPFLMVQPVRYVHAIETKNYHSDRERIIDHWILTKSDKWEYEQEVRAFCFKQNGLIDFDKKCIKEIYFGCKTAEKDIKSIISILKKTDYESVALKVMETDPVSFNLKSTQFSL